MNRKRESNMEDALNLIIAGGMALFSTLLGSALLIGMATEPEKSETFLVLLGWGVLLGGIGCAIYCFYLLTHKVFKWMYILALVLTFAGYGLALYGQAIYNTHWQ
jgi:uncharacterized membrane protein